MYGIFIGIHIVSYGQPKWVLRLETMWDPYGLHMGPLCAHDYQPETDKTRTWRRKKAITIFKRIIC